MEVAKISPNRGMFSPNRNFANTYPPMLLVSTTPTAESTAIPRLLTKNLGKGAVSKSVWKLPPKNARGKIVGGHELISVPVLKAEHSI